MINLIIFSKDRAMQLDGLLRSLYKYCDIYNKITIVYTFSNDEFRKGYEILKRRFDNIFWKKESDFKNDVLGSFNYYKYTSFLVDDCLFFKSFDLDKNEVLYELDKGCCAISLRLGDNCKYCGKSGLKYDNRLGGYFWNWKDGKKSFGYPLSVDGNMFETKEIVKILHSTHFQNPNKLETRMQKFRNTLKKKMFCPKESILVSIPVNLVGESNLPNGEYWNYSTKFLNDLYLSGKVINFEQMDFSKINFTHCEVEFKFKNL